MGAERDENRRYTRTYRRRKFRACATSPSVVPNPNRLSIGVPFFARRVVLLKRKAERRNTLKGKQIRRKKRF